MAPGDAPEGSALLEGRGRLNRDGRIQQQKIRSDEAIAPCRMLNFSDMSLIGRKNRCEY